MLLDLLEETQISSYLNERENVVLDFYADWCAPCKKFMSTYDEVSRLPEYKNIVFVKVNVDRFGELSGNYRITSIPTLIFLNKKRALKKLVGYKEKEQFIVELNDYYINVNKPKPKKTTKKEEPVAATSNTTQPTSQETNTEVISENTEPVNVSEAADGAIATEATSENSEAVESTTSETNTTEEGSNETGENT